MLGNRSAHLEAWGPAWSSQGRGWHLGSAAGAGTAGELRWGVAVGGHKQPRVGQGAKSSVWGDGGSLPLGLCCSCLSSLCSFISLLSSPLSFVLLFLPVYLCLCLLLLLSLSFPSSSALLSLSFTDSLVFFYFCPSLSISVSLFVSLCISVSVSASTFVWVIFSLHLWFFTLLSLSGGISHGRERGPVCLEQDV